MTGKNASDTLIDNEKLSLYRELIESACDLIWQCDVHGCFTYVNPAWETTLGYSSEEMLGKKVTDFQSADIAERDLREYALHVNRNSISLRNYETVYLHKMGHMITLVFNVTFVRNKNGAFAGTLGTAQDVTDRKQMEHTLRESEAKFEATFISSPLAMGIASLDGRFVDLNPAFCRLTGYSREEIIGKTCVDIGCFSEDKMSELLQVCLVNNGTVKDVEVSIRIKDGSARHLIHSVEQIQINGVRHFLLTGMDVTEQRRAVSTLREREALFSVMFTNSPALMAMTRMADNKVLHVNKLFLESMGLSEDAIVGKTSQEVGLLKNPVQRQRALEEIRNTGTLKGFEMELRKKNGALIVVLASSELVEVNGELCMITSAIDISKRIEAEKELHKTEALMRTAIENLPLILYVIDNEGYFLRSIGAGLERLGLAENEVVGQSAYIVYKEYPEVVSSIRRAIEGEIVSFETSVAENEYFNVCVPFVASDGTADGIVGVALDVTERARTEEVLQNMQKLESIGILAGGIAHDFNNLLSGIFGYVDLARTMCDDKEVKRYLNATIETMDRARGLTGQLLTFSKGGAPIRSVCAMASYIYETVRFALSGSSVSPCFHLPDDLWACNIDATQIGQVIDNIVINAQQAMPAGGTVDVSAENIPLRDKEHPVLPEGMYIRITVRDYGIGIPDSILLRIFDPFFTTKAKGHGLGLATSYSIVKRHGGAIDAESVPGCGSTFAVYLPAASVEVTTEKKKTVVFHGSGTIMVVDDEDIICTMVSDILTSAGFSVVVKKNCREAVEYLQTPHSGGEQCTAVLFDLVIPGGMGGVEAVAKIREFNTDIPLFALSGYADDPVIMNPSAYGFSGSLAKPFTISELTEMLRNYFGK